MEILCLGNRSPQIMQKIRSKLFFGDVRFPSSVWRRRPIFFLLSSYFILLIPLLVNSLASPTNKIK